MSHRMNLINLTAALSGTKSPTRKQQIRLLYAARNFALWNLRREFDTPYWMIAQIFGVCESRAYQIYKRECVYQAAKIT